MFRKIDLVGNTTRHIMVKIKRTVPLHHLPLEELRKEWAKSHLPAILRTKPGKESSTLTKLRNKEQNIKFWFQ